jgi:hypothetical protein
MTACWKHEHLLADNCATFYVLLPFQYSFWLTIDPALRRLNRLHI